MVLCWYVMVCDLIGEERRGEERSLFEVVCSTVQ